MDPYIERILKAQIYDLVRETPLQYAPRLSDDTGQQVWIKREDLQPIFSFKLRGAYNRLRQLSPAQRARGVIAASAGNHAQGVAMAAAHLQIPATIYMPETTPSIKVDAVRARGAKVELLGDDFDTARRAAEHACQQTSATYVPPYDDPDVIAGQGTVAMEILRQHPGPIDAIFVPVGGGGLIAGIAAYMQFLSPQTRIIAVEPDDAASLAAALKVGAPTELPRVGIFADGVAVRQVGTEPFRVLQGKVSEALQVTTDEICAAIKDIFQDNRSMPEPAGALAVAGLKRYAERSGKRGETLVAIESGANLSFDRLRHVAERAVLGEQREVLLAVSIPEQRGSFLRFCQQVGRLPITEFNYRLTPGPDAHIFVGVGVPEREQQHRELVHRLDQAAYEIVDLTQDELGKLHLRFMVGGRVSAPIAERLYAFEFPERPGALLNFLERLGDQWNITLFHYRNHGAAWGRVLVGIEASDSTSLQQALDRTGYAYQDESDNPAYKLFLR